METYLDIKGCRDELIDSIAGLNTGYWVTLNAIHKDEVRFNCTLQELTRRLNVFCYGNNYRNGIKKLEVRGALQRGNAYEGLHTHIVIMQNGETSRSFRQFEDYTRRQWYRLNGVKGSIYGNLVNVQPIRHVVEHIDYALRDFSPQFDHRDQIIFL